LFCLFTPVTKLFSQILNRSYSPAHDNGTFDGTYDEFENEPPLLEELGIHFDHIISKTQAVVNPAKAITDNILDDADLAGPLFFCLLLGTCLLLSGKVHFGYIYGFSVFGCMSMNVIINLLHATYSTQVLDFWRTCSGKQNVY
jgi:protein YIPF5/7